MAQNDAFHAKAFQLLHWNSTQKQTAGKVKKNVWAWVENDKAGQILQVLEKRALYQLILPVETTSG